MVRERLNDATVGADAAAVAAEAVEAAMVVEGADFVGTDAAVAGDDVVGTAAVASLDAVVAAVNRAWAPPQAARETSGLSAETWPIPMINRRLETAPAAEIDDMESSFMAKRKDRWDASMNTYPYADAGSIRRIWRLSRRSAAVKSRLLVGVRYGGRRRPVAGAFTGRRGWYSEGK